MTGDAETIRAALAAERQWPYETKRLATDAALDRLLARLEAAEETLAALEDILDVAERARAGFPIESEEWYARRDYARVTVKSARAALAAAAPGESLEGVDERSSPGSSSDAPVAATRLAPAPSKERWPCGCVKGETPHGVGWADCEFQAAPGEAEQTT
jgi:hypothetical protein